MKKFVTTTALALALAVCVLPIAGCSGGSAEYNKPGTQTSTNEKGMVITLDLAEFSENINYFSTTNSLGIPTITSLDVWSDMSSETDSAGESYTFKIASLADDDPYLVVAMYDSGSAIYEARVVWETTSAAADAETFREYSLGLISSVSGVNYETAASMYSIVYASQYTNGSSDSIVYAYTGSIRCYYMVSGDYSMLVVEAFSSDVQSEDVATGSIVYTGVDASGTDSSSSSDDSSDSDDSDSSDDSDDSSDDSDDSGNIPVTSSE